MSYNGQIANRPRRVTHGGTAAPVRVDVQRRRVLESARAAMFDSEEVPSFDDVKQYIIYTCGESAFNAYQTDIFELFRGALSPEPPAGHRTMSPGSVERLLDDAPLPPRFTPKKERKQSRKKNRSAKRYNSRDRERQQGGYDDEYEDPEPPKARTCLRHIACTAARGGRHVVLRLAEEPTPGGKYAGS